MRRSRKGAWRFLILQFAAVVFVVIDAQSVAAQQAPSRDVDGPTIVHAVKLTQPLKLDGRLDEEVYTTFPPTTGFFQTVPNPGKPATERTDVWVLFDADNIYVSARCWDSAGERAWIAHDMRRDQFARDNDNFGVMFDTYHDRRNGVAFYSNQLGALGDYQINN